MLFSPNSGKSPPCQGKGPTSASLAVISSHAKPPAGRTVWGALGSGRRPGELHSSSHPWVCIWITRSPCSSCSLLVFILCVLIFLMIYPCDPSWLDSKLKWLQHAPECQCLNYSWLDFGLLKEYIWVHTDRHTDSYRYGLLISLPPTDFLFSFTVLYLHLLCRLQLLTNHSVLHFEMMLPRSVRMKWNIFTWSQFNSAEGIFTVQYMVATLRCHIAINPPALSSFPNSFLSIGCWPLKFQTTLRKLSWIIYFTWHLDEFPYVRVRFRWEPIIILITAVFFKMRSLTHCIWITHSRVRSGVQIPVSEASTQEMALHTSMWDQRQPSPNPNHFIKAITLASGFQDGEKRDLSYHILKVTHICRI